jgi:hypothetical protein
MRAGRVGGGGVTSLSSGVGVRLGVEGRRVRGGFPPVERANRRLVRARLREDGV